LTDYIDVIDATMHVGMAQSPRPRHSIPCMVKPDADAGTLRQHFVAQLFPSCDVEEYRLYIHAARAAVRRAVHGQQRSVTEAKWPGLTVSLPPMGEASSSAVALAAAGCPSKAKDVERVKDAAVAEARSAGHARGGSGGEQSPTAP